MRDYSFGNFICALRRGRGLSQFQLGALVGVSDKAVSKWENGTAKPRLETCHRLAAVLGVNINDLLSCKYREDSPVRKDVYLMCNALWERAHEQLKAIYGPEPPIECWSRLETEEAVLKHYDIIVSYDAIGKILQKASSKQCSATVRGMISTSFAAWLMGATKVNPLPAHYRCPACHHIEFHSEVESGFDLPAASCRCGTPYCRDGHNLVFEGYAKSLTHGNYIEINVSEEFESIAIKTLQQYYDGQRHILPVEMDSAEGYPGIRRYVVLSKEESVPPLSTDGFFHMSPGEFYSKYLHHTSYMFLVSERSDKLQKALRKAGREPEVQELLKMEVVECVFQERCTKLPHITVCIPQTEPCNFSLLARIDGFNHGTGAWEENGETLVRSGKAGFRDLAAFREDVWDAIVARISPTTLSGTGLPLRVMDDVRMGRYSRRGVPEEIARLFREIGMPAWYEEYVTKIGYLFPKSHCVAFLMDDLAEAWCQLRLL